MPSTAIVMNPPLTPERKRSAAWPTETPAILEMWWSSKEFIQIQALRDAAGQASMRSTTSSLPSPSS